MTGQFVDKEKRNQGKRLRAGLLAFVFLLVASCGGSSSSSGPPPPLPNDQIGSISPTNNSLANCYISDISACSSTQTTGTNPITALAAATIGSTNFLYWGDGGGNIYSTSSLLTTPPTSTSSLSACTPTTPTTTKILSLAVVPSSNSPELFYATSGGVYEGALGSGGACSTFAPSGPLSGA